MKQVLLVEDDSAVASLIVRSLSEEGYSVSLAPDGQLGWDMVMQSTFDLIILDIMVPKINGLDLCRKIRDAKIGTPILMLTALGTTQNIVSGLDSGADDYMVKPYKLEELLARTRSMMRRGVAATPEQEEEKEKNNDYLSFENLQLDRKEKTALRAGKRIALTATEYRLLEYLLQNKKRVLSRMDILEQVWGIDFNMNTKVVDVYVNYLRKKIDNGYEPKLIHTVIGMGYILKAE